MDRLVLLKGSTRSRAQQVPVTLSARINAALPQTQCTRCGFPDCAAYASAIALDGAAINQCPPGGVEGIARLSAITGQAAQALNPQHGIESPRSVAVIDEDWCIGCTLCLDACPTDAIFGSNKMMHTVIEPHCTGCELCIPVCPVDCISLENTSEEKTGWAAWSSDHANIARDRYQQKQQRRSESISELKDQPHNRSVAQNENQTVLQPEEAPHSVEAKRLIIKAALAKARLTLQKNAAPDK